MATAMNNYSRNDLEGSGEIRPWQWVVIIIIITSVIVGGYMTFNVPVKTPETDEQYCRRVGRYVQLNSLPAVCLKYYINENN